MLHYSHPPPKEHSSETFNEGQLKSFGRGKKRTEMKGGIERKEVV